MRSIEEGRYSDRERIKGKIKEVVVKWGRKGDKMKARVKIICDRINRERGSIKNKGKAGNKRTWDGMGRRSRGRMIRRMKGTLWEESQKTDSLGKQEQATQH